VPHGKNRGRTLLSKLRASNSLAQNHIYLQQNLWKFEKFGTYGLKTVNICFFGGESWSIPAYRQCIADRRQWLRASL
jgi:hypothetical protein